MTRIRRQSLLREMLAKTPASTQHSLVEGLERAGMVVTQATVSRDLASIGAVRGPEGYRLPELVGGGSGRPGPPAGASVHRLESVIREHAIGASRADAIVVLKTAPGHANFVATELDAARPDGMVGCIAGDDTIFIAAPSTRAAGVLAESLHHMMESA